MTINTHMHIYYLFKPLPDGGVPIQVEYLAFQTLTDGRRTDSKLSKLFSLYKFK